MELLYRVGASLLLNRLTAAEGNAAKFDMSAP
jgi:hypothetical protein